MGFDVLYLPPIHPIGHSFRKGKNNALAAAPEDVGSPWAIGAEEGGHTAIHPQLGTLEDFRRLVVEAKKFDIEIALDIAFQCTPDHPYVRSTRSGFGNGPMVRSNTRKIRPRNIRTSIRSISSAKQWEELWRELKRVVLFWCAQGMRIFRADNPHTKPFPFWEWIITEVKRTSGRAFLG